MLYVAQEILQTNAEIAEKGNFRMKTNLSMRILFIRVSSF